MDDTEILPCSVESCPRWTAAGCPSAYNCEDFDWKEGGRMKNPSEMIRRLREAANEEVLSSRSRSRLLREAAQLIADMQLAHQISQAEIVRLRRQVEAAKEGKA